MKEFDSLKRSAPWWPAAVTACCGLIACASLIEHNWSALIACLVGLGIVAYCMQIYWEFTARRTSKVKEALQKFMQVQMVMLLFGFLLDALQREDLDSATTYVLFLGICIVIPFVQTTMSYRTHLLAQKEAPPPTNTHRPLP